jgi:spore coat polysaccharide biosynthesis protein SpsF
MVSIIQMTQASKTYPLSCFAGMKVRALIQARMGSTRLKGKVLMPVAGIGLLRRVIAGARRLKFVNEIMVATTDLPEDDPIVEFAANNQIMFFRGSASDVLSRFVQASQDLEDEDCIVRVTADNPFNNAMITNKVFELHKDNGNDYTCITGLSHVVNEFVKVRCLRSIASDDRRDNFDREHVTAFFRRSITLFKVQQLPVDFLGLNAKLDKLLTIDTPEDLARIERLAKDVDISNAVDFKKVYKWLKNHK